MNRKFILAYSFNSKLVLWSSRFVTNVLGPVYMEASFPAS